MQTRTRTTNAALTMMNIAAWAHALAATLHAVA
jgi:hypothetical protein